MRRAGSCQGLRAQGGGCRVEGAGLRAPHKKNGTQRMRSEKLMDPAKALF
jgi:hypothetical protein